MAKVPAKRVSTTEGKPTRLAFIPNSRHLEQAVPHSCLQQPRGGVCWTATQASGILFFFIFYFSLTLIQTSRNCSSAVTHRGSSRRGCCTTPRLYSALRPFSRHLRVPSGAGAIRPSVHPSVRPSGLPVREGLLGPAKARWCLRAAPGPS